MGSIVYDMAGRIVENLQSVADQSSGSLQGRSVNIALQKLKDEISSIRRVLVDAEKKQFRDANVSKWLAKVEDVLHDIDNLVDEFGFKVSGCRSRSRSTTGKKMITEVGNSFSNWSNHLVFWPKMNHRIKEYRKELSDLMGETLSTSLNLEEQEQEQSEEAFSGLWKIVSSSPRENINIGREYEKGKIIDQRLLSSVDDDRERVPVLPIVGVAGVGKTRLAQFVYNDDRVRNHFDLRMWVHISKSFDYIWILKKVLMQSTKDLPQQYLNIENIRDIGDEREKAGLYFREEIATKRFLLVLDGMWMNENCEDQWSMVRSYLLSNVANRGSRVIVTTRDDAKVAKMTGTMETFRLCPLNEDQSWSLFKSFLPDGQLLSNVHIAEIGKKIVDKCEGNPFVIQAISGMLLFRDPETKWHLMEKDLSEIFKNGDKEVLPTTVELSFEDLPSNLKKCFAYCCLFPKDYEIDVETLIKLWVSEGLIHQENAGYECFLKLLWRSFFEESKRDDEGNVTKCKVKNLMHEHVKSVLGNRCITFAGSELGEIHEKRTRHVSFDLHLDSLWQIPNPLLDAKYIRTILLPSQLRWEIGGRSDKSICGIIVSKFRCLRMLDLHNSGIKVVPESISKLKFLRYLDLSQNSDIKMLPKSFTKLRYLQTLKLNNCGRLRKLPEDIEKLNNLRNLEINSCHSLTHMPRGIGKLTHLQILSEFALTVSKHNVDSVGGLSELSTLNNLRGEIRVKNLSPAEGTEEANLSGKQFLQSLMLIWDVTSANKFEAAHYEDSLEGLKPHPNLKELSLSAYGGSKFPSWLPDHTNLVKFFLWRCTKCQHLPPLNHLPNLKVLVLEDMTDLEYVSEQEYSSAQEFFPSLKELRLTNLQKLRQWWQPRDGQQWWSHEESVKFPCLSKLIIEDCLWLGGSMPRFPDLEELLVLKNTRWEPFQQTINAGQVLDPISKTTAASHTTAPNSTSSSPLSKLTTLCIVEMWDGVGRSDIRNMLQSLSSLCPLPRLCSLTLDHLPEIEYFLHGFQHVTSLQELNIWRCLSLREIPTWEHLSSLRKLSIRLCPNLMIPPERISHVTSIQKVEIEDCPNDRFFMR